MARRIPRGARALGVVGVVALLLATGCSRTVDAAPAAGASVRDEWPGCDAIGAFDQPYGAPDLPGRGAVPAGFAPTQAVLCATGEQTAANGDLVGTDLERTATELDGLLGYLDRRNQVATGDVSCPAMAWSPPALYLLDADRRWIVPQVPTDPCGFALDLFTEAGPAYARLAYRDRVVRETGVHESAASQASGCAMQWKNVIAALTAEGSARPAAVGTDPWATGVDLRACSYAVPAADRGADLPVGDFASGRVLDPRPAAALRAATAVAPAARSCRTPAARFAVLTTTDGGGTVYLELDGCRRLLVDDGSGPARLAQGDASLVELVTG